jgi:hypothetical protein
MVLRVGNSIFRATTSIPEIRFSRFFALFLAACMTASPPEKVRSIDDEGSAIASNVPAFNRALAPKRRAFRQSFDVGIRLMTQSVKPLAHAPRSGPTCAEPRK